jgi:hypothetical protein
MKAVFVLLGLFVAQSVFASHQAQNGDFVGRSAGLFAQKCSLNISESPRSNEHQILQFSVRIGCRGSNGKCYTIGEDFAVSVKSQKESFSQVRQWVAPSGNLFRTQSTLRLSLDREGRPRRAKFVQVDESLTPGQPYRRSMARTCRF